MTSAFGGQRSIQLSYGCKCRLDGLLYPGLFVSATVKVDKRSVPVERFGHKFESSQARWYSTETFSSYHRIC